MTVPLSSGTAPAGPGRAVVVLPGGAFGPYAPTLFFPMWAAQRRGATVLAVEWEDVDGIMSVPPELAGPRVTAQVEPASAGREASFCLVVGKSPGSLAIPLVADRGMPAVWPG